MLLLSVTSIYWSINPAACGLGYILDLSAVGT